jgi:hypothetical protein
MIRRIINWFAYLLHIKKRERKSALDSLLGLLPILVCYAVIRGAVKWVGLPPLPWYLRLIFWIKHRIRYVRAIVIGY